MPRGIDMFRHRHLVVFTVVIAAGLALGVRARAAEMSAVNPAPHHPQKMKMDEPMRTGMMKKDMRKGDVKSAAEKKIQALRPMMEQEQKSMPQDKAKP